MEGHDHVSVSVVAFVIHLPIATKYIQYTEVHHVAETY